MILYYNVCLANLLVPLASLQLLNVKAVFLVIIIMQTLCFATQLVQV